LKIPDEDHVVVNVKKAVKIADAHYLERNQLEEMSKRRVRFAKSFDINH